MRSEQGPAQNWNNVRGGGDLNPQAAFLICLSPCLQARGANQRPAFILSRGQLQWLGLRRFEV
jgi:hypothetical protein